MKKMKLNLDQLNVESFETADIKGSKGTVVGQATKGHQDCQNTIHLACTKFEDCQETMIATCHASCDDICIFSDPPRCEPITCP